MGKFHDHIYQGFKYKLYVPKSYEAKNNTPLVVMLHGCGQDPDDFATGTNMNNLAEQENFLVLYPNMNHLFNPSDPAGYNPYGCWNWFLDKNQHRGQGHPKLIFEIIEEVKRGYSIDVKHVYAAGLSAGGSLACILGVTYPDVFSAIGICSGLAYDAANVFFLTDPMAEDAKKSMEKGVPDPYACGNSAFLEMGEHKKKMRVIVFHGICDTTVHPINSQQVITQWAQTNFLVEGGKGNVDVTPSKVNAGIINGKSYSQHIYSDLSGEVLLELWMVDKMGHVWSGGSSSGSYTDSLGPNASEIMWNFFTKKQQLQEEKITIKEADSKTSESTYNGQIEYSADVPAKTKEQSQDPVIPNRSVQIPDNPPVQHHAPTSDLLHSEKADSSSDHAPVEQLIASAGETAVQALDDSIVKSPIQSAERSSVHTPVQSTSKKGVSKSTVNSLSQTVNQSPAIPKKKLIFTLLSKLTKKKK